MFSCTSGGWCIWVVYYCSSRSRFRKTSLITYGSQYICSRSYFYIPDIFRFFKKKIGLQYCNLSREMYTSVFSLLVTSGQNNLKKYPYSNLETKATLQHMTTKCLLSCFVLNRYQTGQHFKMDRPNSIYPGQLERGHLRFIANS